VSPRNVGSRLPRGLFLGSPRATTGFWVLGRKVWNRVGPGFFLGGPLQAKNWVAPGLGLPWVRGPKWLGLGPWGRLGCPRGSPLSKPFSGNFWALGGLFPPCGALKTQCGCVFRHPHFFFSAEGRKKRGPF